MTTEQKYEFSEVEVKNLQQENDRLRKALNYFPPDHGDECWQIGAETYSRKEVAHLLHTQRAMIINDLKMYCGNDLTPEMFDILKNPRKPEY